MPALGLNHYNLRAPRILLDALRDFYRDVVGLEPGPRPPFRSFGYWLYARTEAVLHLSESRPDELRRAASDTTFDHVAFACTDWSACVAHLDGLSIQYSVNEVPVRNQYQIFFRDPAGNGIELNFSDEHEVSVTDPAPVERGNLMVGQDP